jgi:hypothetical protein
MDFWFSSEYRKWRNVADELATGRPSDPDRACPATDDKATRRYRKSFPDRLACNASRARSFPPRLAWQGFAGLDAGLSKRWKMPYAESHNLIFRWEVYNVLNLTRFDVQSVTTDIASASFGNYSGLLTNPRVMQFALRYEF